MKATCSPCRQGESVSGPSCRVGVGSGDGEESVTAELDVRRVEVRRVEVVLNEIVAKRRAEVYKRAVLSETVARCCAIELFGETRLADRAWQFKLIEPIGLTEWNSGRESEA